MFKNFLYLIFINIILSCKIERIDTTLLTFPVLGNYTERYNLSHIQSHFIPEELGAYLKNDDTSYSCIDARSDKKIFGTPGGLKFK